MKIFLYSVREDEKKYIKQFEESGQAEIGYTSAYPAADNMDLAAGYDAVSVITNVVTTEMYDRWHELGVQYVATRTVGYDHLDVAYMKELGMRGVHATYSPNAVANYAIMLMLMACRKINFILDKARLQDFSLKGKIGKEISQSTVGIIGCGQIGSTVVKHLSGFGCRILVNSEYENKEVEGLVEYVDLDTLYKEADIISLHVPGMEKNRHMIDSDAIAKMKDDVILVNTARGLLIDSEALIDGLESGKIGFAALDTIEEEIGLYYKNLEGKRLPNRVRAILSTYTNVILSPHMAFYTEQSSSDMVLTSCQGLVDLHEHNEHELELEVA